jgi:hypothetical protein
VFTVFTPLDTLIFRQLIFLLYNSLIMEIPKQAPGPESLSKDPNVFERTLIMEQIKGMFEKIQYKLYAEDPHERRLEKEDYDFILQKMNELGVIGYISTPGYPSPEENEIAEPDAEIQKEKEERLQTTRSMENLVKNNVINSIYSLLKDLRYLNLPEDFTDKLYASVAEHMKFDDSNTQQILYILHSAGLAPKSIGVIKEVAGRVLENTDLHLYAEFLKKMQELTGQPASSVELHHAELESVFERMKQNPKVSEATLFSMSNYVQYYKD